MRSLSTNFYHECLSNNNKPVFLFEGVFSNSFNLNLWTGVSELSWGGKTWLGNGWLYDFSTDQENEGVNAHGMQIHLSGVASAVISLILKDSRLNSLGSLYFSFLDNDNNLVDPYLLFRGKFDKAEIVASIDNPQVVLYYENELIQLERTKEFRFNSATQKIFYPEDRGFEYVEWLQDQVFKWGKDRVEKATVLEKPKSAPKPPQGRKPKGTKGHNKRRGR